MDKWQVILIVVVLLIPLSAVASTLENVVVVSSSPQMYQNFSSMLNQTVLFRVNSSQARSITNVSFQWVLMDNQSEMALFVVGNGTPDQAVFVAPSDGTVLPSGAYMVNITAANHSAEGNVQSTLMVASVPVQVDRAPPQFLSVRWNVSANATIAPSQIQVNVTVSDSGSGVRAAIIGFVQGERAVNVSAVHQGGAWIALVPIPASFVDGPSMWHVYAVDGVGNSNVSQLNTSFILDVTPPQLSTFTAGNITQGANLSMGWSDHTITVMAGVNDSNGVAAVSFAVNASNGSQFFLSPSFVNGVWNTSLQLSKLTEGSHAITVSTVDTYGNTRSEVGVMFLIDRTVPSVDVQCRPGIVITGQPVNCTCFAGDSLSGVLGKPLFDGEQDGEFLINPSAGGSFTSPICRVFDYAGNLRTNVGNYRVDGPLPVPAVSNALTGAAVGVSAEDGSVGKDTTESSNSTAQQGVQEQAGATSGSETQPFKVRQNPLGKLEKFTLKVSPHVREFWTTAFFVMMMVIALMLYAGWFLEEAGKKR